MYTYPWYHWITFFYIYCFLGWIFESSYVSLKAGHFVNRGFLRLPMLPLYGTGAIAALWVSLPVKDNLLLIYLAGMIAATILEYVTGYIMERLFKMRYWDYSYKKLQINGYICLSSSIAWGFLTILLTQVIQKPIARLVLSMNPFLEFSLIGIVSVLFLLDLAYSTREALDLGCALETLSKIQAEFEEIQVQLSLLKAETALKIASVAQKVSDHYDQESSLVNRLRALNEHRQKISHHMSAYRNAILRRNPSANSSKFANALKELKEAINSKYF